MIMGYFFILVINLMNYYNEQKRTWISYLMKYFWEKHIPILHITSYTKTSTDNSIYICLNSIYNSINV